MPSEKKQIYDRIFSEVTKEKNEDNKNKYSNDTIREIETNNRLGNDAEYLELSGAGREIS